MFNQFPQGDRITVDVGEGEFRELGENKNIEKPRILVKYSYDYFYLFYI